MAAETISGIPSSLEATILSVDSYVKKIEAERSASYALLDQTIFPDRIRELSRSINSGVGCKSPYDIWEDMSINSGVLDLFFNIHYIHFLMDKEGMRDVYFASAVSVEMFPTGVLILRGGTDVRLMPDEWQKNRKAQLNAFTRVLIDPKDILFNTDVSMPAVYD